MIGSWAHLAKSHPVAPKSKGYRANLIAGYGGKRYIFTGISTIDECSCLRSEGGSSGMPFMRPAENQSHPSAAFPIPSPRRVALPARRLGFDAQEARPSQIKPVDEGVNEPHRIDHAAKESSQRNSPHGLQEFWSRRSWDRAGVSSPAPVSAASAARGRASCRTTAASRCWRPRPRRYRRGNRPRCRAGQ